MRCDEFETRLNEVLDLRLPPESDAELAAHARECASCRTMLEGARCLLQHVASARSPEAPPDLAERTMEALHDKPARRGLLIVASVGLAVAASLLIVILPQWLGPAAPARGPANPRKAPAVAQTQEKLDAQHVAIGPSVPSHSVMGDEEYLAMMRLTGQAMAILPNTVRRASQTPEMALVTEGMRPVTHSVTAVFTALRDTLPSKADSAS